MFKRLKAKRIRKMNAIHHKMATEAITRMRIEETFKQNKESFKTINELLGLIEKGA